MVPSRELYGTCAFNRFPRMWQQFYTPKACWVFWAAPFPFLYIAMICSVPKTFNTCFISLFSFQSQESTCLTWPCLFEMLRWIFHCYALLWNFSLVLYYGSTAGCKYILMVTSFIPNCHTSSERGLKYLVNMAWSRSVPFYNVWFLAMEQSLPSPLASPAHLDLQCQVLLSWGL